MLVRRLMRRLRRLDRRLLMLQLCIALLGGVLVMLALETRPQAPNGTRAESAAPSEPSAVPGNKLVERTQAAVAADLRADPNAELSSLPPFVVPVGLISVDGTAFQRGDDVVRLDGVQGPRRDDICRDDEGRMWACGLHARAALHKAAAGRPLRCQPRRSLQGGEIAADCVIEREAAPDADLAELLVASGWARPTSAGHLTAQAEQARTARLGLWRGDWTVVARGP